MTDRPPIPSKIKREVRQRCGFGCVICGSPIYEYEHMVEWCKTHHHRADELTLLCSQHHAEKTKRLLPEEKVKAANNNPYNLARGA
jgi:5-methylcytosine-specific restriction endonuclease McrA